jgi:hypothetical protein
LYKEQSIEARLYQAARYKRIVLNNEDDFKRFISELNEIINENTDNADLRKLLNDMSISIPNGAKGNKLLELVYNEILKDTENLVAPFFYLYNLRLWSDHSIDKTTYNEVLNKLALKADASFSDIMNTLFEAVTVSCKELTKKIKELP